MILITITVCRRPLLRDAFICAAPRASSAPRKRRCWHARVFQPRTWAAQWAALEALDVRLSLRARGDNHHAYLVVGARFLQRSALLQRVPARAFLRSLHETLPVFVSVSALLCVVSPLLCRLSSPAGALPLPRIRSRLCRALVACDFNTVHIIMTSYY